MTLRRKGSRPITVDEVPYRWNTRHKPTYDQGLGHSPMTIAVQHARQPGSVLVVRLPHAHPGNWLLLPYAAVTPRRIAAAIREALTHGWQPTCPGGPFLPDLGAVAGRPC